MEGLEGLVLLETEIVQLIGEVESQFERGGSVPSVYTLRDQAICQRCESRFNRQAYILVTADSYCPFCIQFGRCQTDNTLTAIQPRNGRFRATWQCGWTGRLMPQQELGSQRILFGIQKKRPVLIHGVTGAGKTEMLFQGLEYGLKAGLKIAIVSPRVDVCLELYPRIQEAFPAQPISLLYGGEKRKLADLSLVVATVHQLFRFKKWFDVIIVDEVDAFPLEGDDFLARGIQGALTQTGITIYLTATLTKSLKLEVSKQLRGYQMVPLRFHQQPLPQPKCVILNQKRGVGEEVPWKLRRLLKRCLENNRTLLIFCPSILRVEALYKQLLKQFPSVSMTFSHSRDPDRERKISNMRAQVYQWFLTTTILERGVTFPGIDVIVLAADHMVFNQASLVQIAGRVGRSHKEPTGSVWFLGQGYTTAIKGCIKEIKQMNRSAERLRKELKG